jgi:hypothetical protein
MDEDQILQSIIADPDVVDPTIDVSKLRQTTPTSSRLLGNVSGIEGLRFDPTRTDYIRDLYSVYGGGLPTIDVAPVVDTTTPVVNTTTPTVDIGGGGGGTDQVTGGGGTTPTETIIPDPVVAPGEIPVTQEEIDAFNAPAVLDSTSTADEIMQDLTNQQAMLNPTGGNIIDEVALTGQTDFVNPADVEAGLATESIADFTPETQGLVNQAFSKVGSTASDIMNDLSQIPGAIADFANQTVDIAGQKINVGATFLRAGINKIVGGPISLVFDVIGASGLEGGRGDLSDALGEKYGMDDIGRLTGGPMAGYSVGPNHAQTVQDRIDNIKNRTAPQTEASEKKIAELEAYKSEVIATGSSGVITEPGTVVGPGETPVTQEEIDAFNAPPADINIVDEVALTGLPEPEITADEGFQDIDFGEPEVTADAGFGQADQGEAGSDAGFGQADQGEAGSDAGFSDTGFDNAQAAADAQAAANQDAARGGGGGSSGGGKIVCTMMNDSYGFGSFRNKIWLRHSKDLAPEYQKGYHKIFLPLVKLSKNNKVLKIMLEHIAVHRTIDIRQEARGKVHLLGRVYRKILEPICYLVGKYAK